VCRRSVVRTPGKCETQTTQSVSGGSSPSGEPDTYLARCDVTGIKTQTFQLQGAGAVVCGHLCLHVLSELTDGKKFETNILALV